MAQNFNLLTSFGQPQLQNPVQSLATGFQEGAQRAQQQQAQQQQAQLAQQQLQQKGQIAQQKAGAATEEMARVQLGKAAAFLKSVPPEQRAAQLNAIKQEFAQQGLIQDQEDLASLDSLSTDEGINRIEALLGPQEKQPLVQIGDTREKTLTQERAKSDIKKIDRFSAIVENNQAVAADVAALEQVIKRVQSGLGGDKRLILQQARALLGDKEAANIASDAELMQGLSNKLALAQKKPGSGSMSDKDLEVYQSVTAGINNTPEGNLKKIQAFKAGAARDQARLAFAEEYLAENGNTIGMEKQWDKYSRNNRLFDEEGNVLPQADFTQYLNPKFEGSKGTQVVQRKRFNPETGDFE